MAENKQIINSNDMWQNLRFCYHTMANLKAIYFYGELGAKQDLNSVLFELVAKKYNYLNAHDTKPESYGDDLYKNCDKSDLPSDVRNMLRTDYVEE